MAAGMVDAERLLEAEKEVLKGMGWVEGTSLPANLSDYLGEQESIFAGTKSLETAVQQAVASQEAGASLAGLSPEIAEGVRAAELAAKHAEQAGLTRDKPAEKEATPAPPEAQSSAPPAEPAVKFEDKPPLGYTVQDKDAFLIAIRTGVPFEKTFTFFGGEVAIKVRRPTAAEVELIATQLIVDAKLGRIASNEQYFDLDTQYSAAIQTAAITFKSKGRKNHTTASVLSVPRSVLVDTEKYKPEDTVLRWYRDVFHGLVVPDDTMLRSVNMAMSQFNAIFNYLIKQANNENFWKPTIGS